MKIPNELMAHLLEHILDWQTYQETKQNPKNRITPLPSDGLEQAVSFWMNVNNIRLPDLEDTIHKLNPSED